MIRSKLTIWRQLACHNDNVSSIGFGNCSQSRPSSFRITIMGVSVYILHRDAAVDSNRLQGRIGSVAAGKPMALPLSSY